jgi:hypothetical protein
MVQEQPLGSSITLPVGAWFTNYNGLTDTGVSLAKIADMDGGRLKQVPSEAPTVVKV